MHKRGYSRHAVSVCVSVCHVRGSCENERTYLHNFFTFGYPHHSSLSTPDGVEIFRREPPLLPNGSVECKWGIGRNRDSGLIAAGYRRLYWTCEVPKTFTDEAECMTQSATHHWLSIDCWTRELRSDKNSYRRPCSVDRTVGDAPANVCL